MQMDNIRVFYQTFNVGIKIKRESNFSATFIVKLNNFNSCPRSPLRGL